METESRPVSDEDTSRKESVDPNLKPAGSDATEAAATEPRHRTLPPAPDDHTSVRRREAPAASDAAAPRPRKAASASRSLRVKSGNPLRELLVLLAVVAAGMFLALEMERPPPAPPADDGAPEGGDAGGGNEIRTLVDMAESMNRAVESLGDAIKRKILQSRGARAASCAVFLSESTLPGAGKGLLAGRDFRAGEVVLSASRLVPVDGALDGGAPAHRVRLVSDLAFTVKHHPTLVNVEGRLWTDDGTTGDASAFQLTATRPITAGEELFVAVEAHPAFVLPGSVFARHIPVRADYETADRIRQEAATRDRAIQLSNNSKKGQQRRKIQVDPLYAAVRQAVALMDPGGKVAGLLPTSKAEADQHTNLTSSLYGALKNKTLDGLQLWGSCMGDLGSMGADRIIANRTVSKGMILTELRLYAIRNPMTCEASIGDNCLPKHLSHCISSVNHQLWLCPLSHVPSVGDVSNVEAAWDKALKSKSIEDILNMPLGSITANLVALKDVEAGSELRLPKSSLEQLFMSHWKI